MWALPVVDHVDDFVRGPRLDAVIERGEVGGHVIESRRRCRINAGSATHSPSLFTRKGSSFGGRNHHRGGDGASGFAFAGDAAREQILYDAAELGIVKTFAQHVIEFHAEATVDWSELLFREANHFLPDGKIFGVAALKLDQFGHGGAVCFGIVGGLIGVALGAYEAVYAIQFRNRVAFQSRLVERFSSRGATCRCVPQCPIWLSLMTRWPMRRKMRCNASPMPVERMWPACMGLARRSAS